MKRPFYLPILLAALLALPASAQVKKDTKANTQSKKAEMIAQYAVPTWGVHPWAGKRIGYFGDSITDPRNSGSVVKYWNFLESWLGTTSYVYAVSGRQWDNIPKQADQLWQEHGNEVDAIVIFVGTNDFNAGIPIGEWFEETDEKVLAAVHAPKAMADRKMRTPIKDSTTYCGRINIALEKVKSMYPDKQIVLLTPLHRAYANFSDKNIQPTEAYQNSCGEYFNRYVECVREAAQIWGLPLIDLHSLSGLQPMIPEGLRYFANPERDQLHPNDDGHYRMALTLYYQLGALPGGF
ncbi:MAG: SGNH/GDSL hydrolase family protein [Prevotella sp.]|nr:SGNH/GDSL hydrolase family protein [Prevotella sp.]